MGPRKKVRLQKDFEELVQQTPPRYYPLGAAEFVKLASGGLIDPTKELDWVQKAARAAKKETSRNKRKAKAKKQRKGKQGGRSGRHELMRLVHDERESPAEGEWYVEHARQRAPREPEHEAAGPGEQPIFHLPDFGPPESPGSRSPQSLAGEQMLLPDAGAPGESMAMVD